MLEESHRYTMEFYTEAGSPLGQVALAVDFGPACEWARLTGLRKGELAPAEYDRSAAILPLWHARLSEPYLQGFRIRIGANGSNASNCDFATTYFKELASQAAAHFVKEGKLQSGDRFFYLLAAFPRKPENPSPEDGMLMIEDLAAAVPIRESALADLLRLALPQGEIDSNLLPVFIPSRILDETAECTRRAGQAETGGFLIGHVCFDPAEPEAFLDVTAQIPAIHTVGELTRLSFTPDTWTAVRAAIELRNQGEMLLGWWHSHPVKHWKCKDCPVEKQRTCSLAQGFLSEHDRLVHQAVFSRAWSLAMVLNDVAFAAPSFSLFGWNRGMIEPRGYYIMNSPKTKPAAGPPFLIRRVKPDAANQDAPSC